MNSIFDKVFMDQH